MEIELLEIRNFLAESIPFSLLSDEALDALPAQFQIRYLRRDSQFPPQDNDGRYLYLVRSGAIEIRDNDGSLLNKLAENDYYSNCLSIEAGEQQGKAIEDTLLYQLPCKNVRALRDSSTAFDEHFSETLSQRLKQAARHFQQTVDSGMTHMTVEVHELLKKPPVIMPIDSSIQQVAQMMTEKDMSSVMLMENDKLRGIITDRDLRRKCIARAIDVNSPASEIMSSKLFCIEHNSLALNALIIMTKRNVHHLPVMRGDEVIGMLSATDLAHHSSSNPAFIMSDIRKAQSLEELVTASSKLPDLQVQLSIASVTALHVGEMVSRITDAITTRLIEMAIDEFGPAPVDFVWLAGGSQARREQTSHSDQDNAIVISDQYNPDKHEQWFKDLTARVTYGLDLCGFIYCPGEAMASNPKWCVPLKTWKQYFKNWINKPEPMALMLSSIFFDLRPVYGNKALFEVLQQETLKQTKKAGIFIAYMAANALTHRPPLGFFRRFVLINDGEHNETFDIKHRGIVPITDIARLIALSEGITATNTTERLHAAGQTSSLSHEMAENLIDALAFISELRICHQAKQIRKGIQPDNFLSPNKMSELDRKHLKDAFSVIQEMQNMLEHRYQTGRLG